jgi:hypothetical protein
MTAARRVISSDCPPHVRLRSRFEWSLIAEARRDHATAAARRCEAARSCSTRSRRLAAMRAMALKAGDGSGRGGMDDG